MTTPPTTTQAKTREEWKDDIGSCAVKASRYMASIVDGNASQLSDMHPELAAYRLQRDTILDAIMSLQASETKLRAENQDLYQSLCSTNTQYGQLEEAEKELRAEVEMFGRIKREWDALIEPLLDFGRDNAEHLGLRVGDCIITKALGLMEEKVKKGGR